MASLVWTLTFVGLAFWQVQHLRAVTLELATKEAKANFDKDQAFRFWATQYGGVYVPATEHTPPNPYLAHMPERDIVTDTGRELTLINPAYMLRMLHEQYGDLFGVRGRIVSEDPLRPENLADAWESRALQAFGRGETERVEVTDLDGQPHLRYMAPMVTEQGCLYCHGHQGYQLGDIRGGVSVSVPLQTYMGHERQSRHVTLGSLGAVWLLGLGGLALGYRRLRANDLQEQQSRRALQVANEALQAHAVQREQLMATLVQSNAELTRLGEVMAHHFMEPVRRLMSFSDIVKKRVPTLEDEVACHSLQFIYKEAERLSGLVREVQRYLSLDQLEAGELQSVDAMAVLQQAITDVGLTYGETVVVEASLPPLHFDERRLAWLFFIVLDNARHYRHAERPLKVRVQCVVGTDTCTLRFVDNGIGLAEPYRAQAFDLFTRFVSSDRSGIGMGLAVARRLVQQAHGTIHMEEGDEGGCCVVMTLPLAAS